jgi:hypothetical protein
MEVVSVTFTLLFMLHLVCIGTKGNQHTILASFISKHLGRIKGEKKLKEKKSNELSWALVAYVCNPSYSGGRDQED